MFNLNNKIAVITGASGGIGEYMAYALAKQGAKIIILDIKDASNVIKKIGNGSRFYKIDICNENEVSIVIEKIIEEFNKIDILINNAGIHYPTPVVDGVLDDFKKIIEVNLNAQFIVSKSVINHIPEGGRIINVSSIAGLQASAGSAAYNASKGALNLLTKSMAVELAPKKINVNAILPGLFITPMTEDLLDDLKPLLESSVPLKRAATPDEIGGLTVYLASEESSYMTGSLIVIDGGWTCHL